MQSVKRSVIVSTSIVGKSCGLEQDVGTWGEGGGGIQWFWVVASFSAGERKGTDEQRGVLHIFAIPVCQSHRIAGGAVKSQAKFSACSWSDQQRPSMASCRAFLLCRDASLGPAVKPQSIVAASLASCGIGWPLLAAAVAAD